MRLRRGGRRAGIRDFLGGVYGPDLHAKRINALSDATLGLMTGASLAVAAIGQALALARGLTTKHAIKQVDRLMSNAGIDVWASFTHRVPQQVGTAKHILLAMDWTDCDPDGQSTLVVSLVTSHGRAAKLADGVEGRNRHQAQRLRGRLPAPAGRNDPAGLPRDGPGRSRLRRSEAVRIPDGTGLRLRHPVPRQHSGDRRHGRSTTRG